MAGRLGPEPLLALIEEDQVDEQRNLACSGYDACLGRAAHENWASWTCTHCSRFQPLHRELARSTAPPASRRQADDAPESRPPSAAGSQRRPGGGAGASTSSQAEPRESTGSHTWKEERGLRYMGLEAPSAPALFVEAGRAVAEVIRGRPLEPAAAWDDEIWIDAPDPERLLVSWIGELVERSERSSVRFQEFDIVFLSDRRLVASVRGVRLGEIRVPPNASAYRDPCLVLRRGHVTAMPVLDV